MTVSLAALTLDVEEMLYGSAQVERPYEDSLGTEVTNAADTTWQFTGYNAWKKNDYCEVLDATGAADEIVILDADAVVGDNTVRRAQRGTSAHTGAIAAGTGVRRNPAYPRTTIARFINEVVDGQLWPHVWYRSRRTITTYDPNNSYYALAAADFDVEDVYQLNLTPEPIGTASFAFATGRWTSTAHGLEVGDHVRFTTAGSATPAEYAADTDYWVLAVPTADTFTLGITADASALLAGAANSTANWTFERRKRSYHPFPPGWWEVVTDNAATSTLRFLRIYTVYDQDQTIFYTAKTKPLSSAIASIPDALGTILPWGACWLLLGGTRSAARRHERRALREGENESQVYADASFFKQQFVDLRDGYKRQLMVEKKKKPRFIPALARRG